MAKNKPASKEKTICDKLVNAVATFPAFRSGRRTNPASSDSSLQHDHKSAAASRSGMPQLAKSPWTNTAPEVPIMFDTSSTTPKKKDHPTNQHNQLTVKEKNVPPAAPKVAGPTPTTQLVNSWGEVSTGMSDHPVVPAKAQGKGRGFVPSFENTEPVSVKPFLEARARDKQDGFQGKGGRGKKLLSAKTDDFNNYIDRAGARIRTTTLAGDARKPILAKDSLHGQITDFISRAKHKFQHMPSDVDSSAKQTVIR